MRHRIANALELLRFSLVTETIARQSSHHPRRPSIDTPSIPFPTRGARVVSPWPCLCRIAVAVVVVCEEPRGPTSPIGILGIQMTAVMRREFGTAEPPLSEVELGRGRANFLVHANSLPPWAVLFVLLSQSQFEQNLRKYK